jgi:mono/diheme cytochrome c family protein
MKGMFDRKQQNARSMASDPRQMLLRSALGVLIALFVVSCHENPNSPGVEYMPDMYRSSAIEAYVDYRYPDSLVARRPAEGTIPFNAEYLGDEYNPNLPYPYPNTTEGYQKAGKELENPLPLNEKTLEAGKNIYTTYCDHCHGGKGKGDGPVIEKGGHAPPPSFTGPLKDLPDGKAFHTITYGKGLMGSHARQLNKKERWLVVHYINDLQNGSKKLLKSKAKDTAAPAKTDTAQARTDTTAASGSATDTSGQTGASGN